MKLEPGQYPVEGDEILMGCQWKGCGSRENSGVLIAKNRPGVFLTFALCSTHWSMTSDFLVAVMGCGVSATHEFMDSLLTSFDDSHQR